MKCDCEKGVMRRPPNTAEMRQKYGIDRSLLSNPQIIIRKQILSQRNTDSDLCNLPVPTL